MRSTADLESIHRLSSLHRELLERSSRAGCFYCGAMFDPAEIADWVDGGQVDTGDTADGVTALCPRCGIDAVIPETETVAITPELLSDMRTYWLDR